MIFRSTDSLNDWNFGKGKGSYLTESDAIGLNVKTRILSYLNDCFFDTQSGIDWDNLIGGKSQKAIILQAKATIVQSFGVTDLISFDTIYNKDDRSLELQYEISTIYNETRSDKVEVLAYA